MARKLVGAVILATVAISAIPASAQAPAFGPVSERTFHWKPGTSIERAGANCQYNSDWLLIKGPGVANAKSIDVSPRTQSFDKQSFGATTCSGPDCVSLYVKASGRDAVGPRTVTLKHADGRTTTTTFDVVENAGRCDYGAKK